MGLTRKFDRSGNPGSSIFNRRAVDANAIRITRTASHTMNLICKKLIFALILCLVFSFQAFSQGNVTISGHVSDGATGERLPGATVFGPQSGKGTTTNDFGFFSLSLPQGATEVVFRFVGHAPAF